MYNELDYELSYHQIKMCLQLTVYQREFLLFHCLSMPWEAFHSFQITQEKDLFPCLVCRDGPPHEQRDSS